MIWILLSALLLALSVIGGLVMALSTTGYGQYEKRIGATGFFGMFFIGFVAWLVLSAVMSIHIVDARNIGVVRTFGNINGQIGEGFNITMPWQSVEEYNVRLQVIEPSDSCLNGQERCMNAGSIDVQDVYVQAALNMEVSPDNVQELARNVGQNYTDTIVRNRMEQVTKAVISTYKADTILASREEIRATIRQRMQDELSAYSINVVDFLLTNIDFSPTFRDGIEAKVRAEVDAATERNRIQIIQAQAEQRAAEAQGEADRLRITAEGQAEANRILTESLSPTLIQWETVQKLVDNIQVMLLPSDNNIILPPELLTMQP